MRTVSLIPVNRNTLGAIRKIERVHAVNTDEQNVLNLAGWLCRGRERKQAHQRQSNQTEGEKATIGHF